jgi:hypothetical protein
MAGFDPGRYAEVMDWPLRDLFLGFIERLRDQARRNYEVEMLIWATLAPHQKRQQKPPDVPALLRG